MEPIDPPSVQSPSSLSPRCDVCGHDESSRTLTKLLQFPTSPKFLALLYRMLVSRGSFQSEYGLIVDAIAPVCGCVPDIAAPIADHPSLPTGSSASSDDPSVAPTVSPSELP